jgi:hypothetical protein
VKAAEAAPKLTDVDIFVRLDPVMMTLVPPVVGPEVGLTLVTTGGGVGVGVATTPEPETVKLSIALVPSGATLPPLILVAVIFTRRMITTELLFRAVTPDRSRVRV